MRQNKQVRLIPVPSPTLGYLLFNQRDPADTSRPHPLLVDRDLRRAIVLSLDRDLMVRSLYGSYGGCHPGRCRRFSGSVTVPRRLRVPNRSRARQLLAAQGWTDSDGDGVLDRKGVPLRLELNFPGTSAVRKQMALLAQQQLRQTGIDIVLRQFEYPIYLERRRPDISTSISLRPYRIHRPPGSRRAGRVQASITWRTTATRR